MIRPEARRELQDIADRIASQQPVSLRERALLTKWAGCNHWANELQRKALRRAIQGKPERGTIDELLDGLNLGEPDPRDYIDGNSSIDEFAEFFKSPPDMRRD